MSSSGSIAPLQKPVAMNNERKSRLRQTRDFLCFIVVDQWFLIVLGILILIASQASVPTSQQSIKVTIVDYLCVSIIFFLNGCTIAPTTLKSNLLQWKLHIFIQGLSYLLCSSTAFAIVSAAASNRNFMDPALLVGILILGCVPTAIAFNVTMTKKVNGNTALTVTESIVGNFLGPFLSPVLINMYLSSDAWYTDFLPKDSGGYGEIYRRVFKQLGLSIFLPLAVGQVVQALFPKFCTKVFTKWKLSKLGSLSLLIIIWSTFDGAFASGALKSIPPSNVAFLICMCIVFCLVWFFVTFVLSIFWLARGDVAAAVYCVASKTPAMGVPLTHVLFLGLSEETQSKIQITMVIFQAFQVLLSSLSTIPLRHWIEKEKKRDNESKHEEEIVSSAEDMKTTSTEIEEENASVSGTSHQANGA